MMANENGIEEVIVHQPTAMSDTDRVKLWCTQRKIADTVTDGIITLGFDCVENLALLEAKDVAKLKLPIGHVKRLMYAVEKAFPAGKSANPGGAAAASQSQESAAEASQSASSVPQTAPPAQAIAQPNPDIDAADSPNVGGNVNNNNDAFVREVLAQGAGQPAIPTAQGPSAPTGTLSWQDPQVYIKHLTTQKLAPTHLDITDFVSAFGGANVEEVVSDTGSGQLIYKSGPAKPKLESISQNQWSLANLAILYKLIEDGNLAQDNMLDYLSYTTRVHQLLFSHDQASVFLYDREYRRLQNVHKFRWGTDIPHIQAVFLRPRVTRPQQQQQYQQKRPTQGGIRNSNQTTYTSQGKEICRNYNSFRGCRLAMCGFEHVCWVKGCHQKHSGPEHGSTAFSSKNLG
jgi:hypothetical protein